MKTFPADFLWGAATASYQIEGSPTADGAGPSIWHQFAHTPGNVTGGDTGDIACDHYRRHSEDVALARKLGLHAYRFSIAWPRLLPQGRGTVNAAGIGFYDRLIDELLAAGIRPFATLYHWDLPAALQYAGGWTNRDCAGWFADYSELAFRRFGDRVKDWITLNEPWIVAFLGHVLGQHPPAMRDLGAGLRAVHHLLLGHAGAVERCREQQAGRIGIANVHTAIAPASPDPADQAAAARIHALQNELFLDPIFFGRYPELLLQHWREHWPERLDEDLGRICAPVDFVGVNYYFGTRIRHQAGAGLLDAERVDQGLEQTAMGWEIQPAGLHQVLSWIAERYGAPPIFVTENGAAFEDAADADGEVADTRRTAYLRAHVAAAHSAIADGADLRGYFVWSLLDNFEWTHGYARRFGLIRVDFPTQRRTIKASGRWYAELIRSGALPRTEPETVIANGGS